MFFTILTSLKIPTYHPKTPLNPYKIRLKSNSIKIFKKSIQITQNKTPTPTPFHPQKSSISRNPIIQKSPSHRTHQKSHHKFKHQTQVYHHQSQIFNTHLTLISHTNREVNNIATLLKIYLIKEISNMNNMTNTALQVTDFNFYGDNLIALKDNSTGEIYTAITHILRGIGFIDSQIEYQQSKMLKDELIKSHTLKFSGVELNMPSVNEIWCISQRKLPLALAKINITPKMKKNQPTLSEKLLRYQDKCADVLASVFIDHKSPVQIQMQPIIDTLSTLTTTLITINDRLNNLESKIQTSQPKQLPKKKFSYWSTKMFPKYQLLTDYFNISNRELYKELFRELQNTYPDIDLNQIIDDYCYENHLDTCFTLDAIEHNKEIRTLYETMVDNLLAKYNLTENLSDTKYKTIFDNQ